MFLKAATEFIGTFVLVLCIGISVSYFPSAAPWIICLVLSLLIYTSRSTSGAHFNPAVTLALFARNKIQMGATMAYLLVQFVAAFAAAYLSFLISGKNFAPMVKDNVLMAFLMEFVCTFILVFVIFLVAVDHRTEGNKYYGLAIGLAVVLGIYLAGPFSGAALNPAVAAGAIFQMAFTQSSHSISSLWLYLLAPSAGGLTAALIHKFLLPEKSTMA